MIDKDIIINAYYMISLFEKAHNEDLSSEANETIITQLKLQQLMYLVEAYYMNKYGANSLYNTQWNAWDYGVLNKTLYNYFEKFAGIILILNEEEEKQIDLLSPVNKMCIEKIYEVFSKYDTLDLVTLTYMEGSPSHRLRAKQEDTVTTEIDKRKTKEWFKETFL